jgi:hypothetical protein
MSLTEYREKAELDNETFLEGLTDIETRARLSGAFFTTLESVCDVERVSVTATKFPNIQRDQAQGARLYPTTANAQYLEGCSESNSVRSDATNTEQTFTSVDFLFNLEGERAHLVPNASVCHVAYTKIVQAATGYTVDTYAKRRKLLNGMSSRGRRINDSGIKHSKYNKFHLYQRKQLLDSSPPALIIVPILDLEKIKDWNGTSYDAMVLPCGQRSKLAAKSALQNVRCRCVKKEIETGIEVLRHFIRDIAGSLVDVDQDILEDLHLGAGPSRNHSLVLWEKLVIELRSGRASIEIPVLKNDLKWEAVNVAKGTFSLTWSCLPDPFLLAVKAAINYSSFSGTKLMPACPRPSDESDSGSEDVDDDCIESNDGEFTNVLG